MSGVCYPSNVSFPWFPCVLDGSFKAHWMIKFKILDRWQNERSPLQRNSTFDSQRDDPFKLVSQDQDDDYKVALQGDSLDLRTNHLEGQENYKEISDQPTQPRSNKTYSESQ